MHWLRSLVGTHLVAGCRLVDLIGNREVAGRDHWEKALFVCDTPPAGNDFSTVFAPLVRDGRMDKFYWHPTEEDLVAILHQVSTC